jgi:hypothetical protein
VYYVPKLERNIISLGQLTERGYKIVLEENYLWGYDRQRQLIMKVERSKNRLYYLELDRVDPICDGFLVEEQRSAPFSRESTHVTQDIICEGENLGQTEESPTSSRPTWPEGGGLKEKDTSEEVSAKRKTRYTCMELLNIAVASIIENRPARPEGGRDVCSLVATRGVSQDAHATESKEAWHCLASTVNGVEDKCPESRPARPGAGGTKEITVPPEEESHGGPSTGALLGCTEDNTWAEALEPSSVLSASQNPSSCLRDASLYLKLGCISITSSRGSEDETSATSDAEEYVLSTPMLLELRRLRHMRVCIRRVLDNYPKEALQTVHNPMKMIYKKQGMFIKESVKTEEADKMDDQRQAMEKPVKIKTVTWMIRGTTKAMSTRKTKTAKVVPRVTPTRSKWRIWDPGRSEVVVLRGVIVRIKHDPCVLCRQDVVRIDVFGSNTE